jgi:Uma2 family endonuclease
MSLSIARPPRPAVIYPDSDGEPMSDNTLQYEWIVTIKGNLDILFLDRPDVFVAGDLLWYPVEGDPKTRIGPDVLVAMGRPKGYRGSYKQWEEGGIAPQVVFEILSPGNRAGKMIDKFKFYERYGVGEYYVYDPDENLVSGFQRAGDELVEIGSMDGWVSPVLGIQFDCSGAQLIIRYPDGKPFLTFAELGRRSEMVTQERDVIAQERDAIAQERDTIAQERDRERERAEKLEARFRELEIPLES